MLARNGHIAGEGERRRRRRTGPGAAQASDGRMAKVRAEEHCSAAAAAAVDRRVAGEEEDNGLAEAEAAVDSILPAGVEDNGLAEGGIGLAAEDIGLVAEDTGRSLPVVAVLLDISKRWLVQAVGQAFEQGARAWRGWVSLTTVGLTISLIRHFDKGILRIGVPSFVCS